ncbi:testis-expressed protein 10-like [Asterias amurensis]|uniref:testis-expressed protein 10-like n=1 Tax=Asterias amurensis TaxID=7602 RepID=UPI003AB639B8
MGKSGRKNKEKRKDFQKVKLKVGKKKPQAENFTETTFKSQAIHLREQLKSGPQDEPTTQRKQNIHDLVCHLNHYNGTIRQSSITGMKELLSSYPALMSQHLPLLIDSLSVLMTDKEDAVRRAGISLLQLVLQATPNDSIAPFFPILSAHLSCAMTHIQEDIQMDSLAVLDLILQFYPRLLTAQSRQLLTIFVQQISQQKKKTFGWAENDGETENKLTIKPGSKISSHYWRQKVLMRLRQFLSALLEQHYMMHSHYHSNKTTGVDGTESTVMVNDGQETYAPIFAPCTRVYMNQEEFVLRAPSSATSADDFSKPENLLGFIHSLVPLLLQCWMEVSPKSHQQAVCQLNGVAIEILDGVLAVIQLLWRWMLSICEQKQDFSCMVKLQKLYQKKFINHLLTCFPYTSHNALLQTKKSGKVGTSVSMVNLNLAACEIMSYFMNKSSIENAWLRKIMVYVLETSLEGNDLSMENMKSLLSVVKRLVKVLPGKGSVKDLLQGALTLYTNCHPLSRNKCEALICLDELTFHENASEVAKLIGHDLLQSLPKLLLELRNQRIETSQHALEILLNRASRNQPEALLCIRNNISQFVDPDSGIFLLFPEHLQLAIIHLIHHADPLDLVTLRSLAKCCHDNRVSARNVGYLINIISTSFLDVNLCNETVRDLPFRLSDFISFLCSLSIGCSQADLKILHEKKCQETEETARHLPEGMTSMRLISQDENQRQRHLTIVKSVCLSYNLISSKQQMFDVVLAVFTDLLNHYSMIPYQTAHAVLYTANNLITADTIWVQETVHKLTDCCLATLYMAAAGHAGSYKDGGWLEVMWAETVGLFVKSEKIFVAVMERIHSTSKDLCDLNHIQGVAMVLIRLLQTQTMASVFVKMSDCVNKAVQSVLVHPLATADTRWVTELRYEASVVLNAGNTQQ